MRTLFFISIFWSVPWICPFGAQADTHNGEQIVDRYGGCLLTPTARYCNMGKVKTGYRDAYAFVQSDDCVADADGIWCDLNYKNEKTYWVKVTGRVTDSITLNGRILFIDGDKQVKMFHSYRKKEEMLPILLESFVSTNRFSSIYNPEDKFDAVGEFCGKKIDASIACYTLDSNYKWIETLHFTDVRSVVVQGKFVWFVDLEGRLFVTDHAKTDPKQIKIQDPLLQIYPIKDSTKRICILTEAMEFSCWYLSDLDHRQEKFPVKSVIKITDDDFLLESPAGERTQVSYIQEKSTTSKVSTPAEAPLGLKEIWVNPDDNRVYALGEDQKWYSESRYESLRVVSDSETHFLKGVQSKKQITDQTRNEVFIQSLEGQLKAISLPENQHIDLLSKDFPQELFQSEVKSFDLGWVYFDEKVRPFGYYTLSSRPEEKKWFGFEMKEIANAFPGAQDIFVIDENYYSSEKNEKEKVSYCVVTEDNSLICGSIKDGKFGGEVKAREIKSFGKCRSHESWNGKRYVLTSSQELVTVGYRAELKAIAENVQSLSHVQCDEERLCYLDSDRKLQCYGEFRESYSRDRKVDFASPLVDLPVADYSFSDERLCVLGMNGEVACRYFDDEIEIPFFNPNRQAVSSP